MGSPLSTGRWGIKPAIITRRLAVCRRNIFMVLPRGQLISIRYCGFIACCLPQGLLIDPVFLDRVFPSKVCLSSERTGRCRSLSWYRGISFCSPGDTVFGLARWIAISARSFLHAECSFFSNVHSSGKDDTNECTEIKNKSSCVNCTFVYKWIQIVYG